MTTDRIRSKILQRAFANPVMTPAGWDRDCRCCMSRPNMQLDPDLFSKRAIKGGGERVIVVSGEEIHAWHSLAEVTRFMDAEAARQESNS
jgi:hypothetical protein